jgi:hypothetical protein
VQCNTTVGNRISVTVYTADATVTDTIEGGITTPGAVLALQMSSAPTSTSVTSIVVTGMSVDAPAHTEWRNKLISWKHVAGAGGAGNDEVCSIGEYGRVPLFCVYLAFILRRSSARFRRT